jgi:hypothetical protein
MLVSSKMTDFVRILRAVVASPSDVQKERDAVESVINDVNRSTCADRGIRIELARWETDTYPGFHPEGPQGLIDPILRIQDCDILVGIFWKRFGSPTKQSGSGTEHEFETAYRAWQLTKRPQVMMYFNQQPHTPQSKQETDQWGDVLEFRRKFPPEGLWWPYKGASRFATLLRTHLINLISTTYPIKATPAVTESPTDRLSPQPLTIDLKVAVDTPSEICRDIGIQPTRPVFHIGENICVSVCVSSGCHLLLVNIGSRGAVTILFPNAFQASVPLSPQQWYDFPPNRRYSLPLLGPSGVEKLICLATTEQLQMEGADFEGVVFDSPSWHSDLAKRVRHKSHQELLGVEVLEFEVV